MNFIINERIHAEKLIETGEPSQRSTSRDLKYIAKYLLSGGFSEDYTISFLIDYMDKFNNSGKRWKNTIVGIVKDIRKQNNYYLRDIQEVRITQKEIEAIRNINWEEDRRLNDRLKRYAFGLVVYTKILGVKNKKTWVEISNTTVFCSDIGVEKQKEELREQTFHKLRKLELVEIGTKTASMSINVLFMDWNENDDDIIIPLDELDEFIKYYDIYIEGCKSKKCQDCGKLIIIKSNRTLRCMDCAKLKKNKLQKVSMQKQRKSK